MKLAYSTLAAPSWTVERCVAAAAESDYDAIEWRLADGHLLSPKTPEQVWERIRDSSDRAGIAVACVDTSVAFAHAGPDALVRAADDAVAMAGRARDVGGSAIRVYGGKLPEGMSMQDVVSGGGASLRRVTQAAAAMGVAVLIETHDDWSVSANASALARSGGAGVVWDLWHPLRHGESPEATAAELRGLVGLVHVKDGVRDGTGWRLTLLGEGELPIAEMLALLSKDGYDGYVTVEIEKHWHRDLPDPEVSVPGSARFMREQFGALGPHRG